MISLPIEQAWYKKLISYSLFIGFVGGLSALIYTLATSLPIEKIFGSPMSGLWTGEWWWIPITAFGGGLVAALRKKWNIDKDLPSAIEVGQEALIDSSEVPKLVLLSVISLVFGASLGPSYGIVMLGGGFASYIFGRLKIKNKDKEVEREFTRTGMASSLGSVFTDPLLGTLFTNELSPSKKNQLASSIPQLIAASIGFLVFFGITGSSIQELYNLPVYEFKYIHVFVGALLGLAAVAVLIVFAVIGAIVKKIFKLFSNSIARGIIGGSIVGFITYAIPLSAGSGNGQLSFATSEFTIFSTGFLLLLFIAKMFSISISQNSGFLGGNVFPTLFIGGISGLFIHSLFPEIPAALSVSTMMAAVPGATLSTPVSIILVAALGVGVGTSQFPPIIMAVVVAQLSLVVLRYLKTRSSVSV